MLNLLFGITARIFSNSYLNMFQKLLTGSGEKSSVVNFYTYAGLTLVCFFIPHYINFSAALLYNILIMGFLGAAGNYAIIKALSYGEMSSLAPINSYKPIVALIFGILLLHEVPNIAAIVGILFIIFGTFILADRKMIFSKAMGYRFLALILSGTEAIFIKKVIILSDINTALLYWALSGMIFSLLFALKHPLKISKCNLKNQLLLILSVGIMQYSTNYVFSKMNVAYALALFQLSVIVSVFIGVNVFKEKGLLRKLAASFVMITGAVIIILN